MQGRALAAAVLLLGAAACSRDAADRNAAVSTTAPMPARAKGTGAATLTWAPLPKGSYGPAGGADPIVGFRIYLGPSPETLQFEAAVADPAATRFVVKDLPKGKHYYAVTTYTQVGIESARSAVVSKDVL